jgi:transposase
MARVRRSREWWMQAVERWQHSGLKVREFAEREGLPASSLWYWSSKLGHGTRAKRGSKQAVALEVQLASTTLRGEHTVEVEVLGAVIRLPANTDAAFLATLVRSLAGR